MVTLPGGVKKAQSAYNNLVYKLIKNRSFNHCGFLIECLGATDIFGELAYQQPEILLFIWLYIWSWRCENVLYRFELHLVAWLLRSEIHRFLDVCVRSRMRAFYENLCFF